jgi:ABC-2 type transport system permease protein
MPLFFASNALYPINQMPSWLQVIAHANPLSYLVDALRSLMIVNATPGNVGLDFVVMIAVTLVLVLIGSFLYPKIVQ